MTVLLVDWLGRGGIAQCTEAWAIELAQRSKVVVVTRGRRELTGGTYHAIGTSSRSALLAHARVVRLASRTIERLRPDFVVVQNYILPFAERAVFRAAHAVGATLIVVVHDHRLHAATAGTTAGLKRNLHDADHILVHSRFVGEEVLVRYNVSAEILPHPIPVGMPGVLDQQPRQEHLAPGGTRLAVHFGILKRNYKGTASVLEMAASPPPEWEVHVLGSGAGGDSRATTTGGYIPAADLVRIVRGADAALFPYTFATQSGAVALSQALGTVPVATAVGGIVEQIEHGRDGLLLRAGAGPQQLRAALALLSNDSERAEMANEAFRRARQRHAEFVRIIQQLTVTR